MELKEFQQNFGGRYPSKEFVYLHAFQQEMPHYAQGFYLQAYDKSGLKTWSEDPHFLRQLMPFAQANSSGATYALWDDGQGKPMNEMPVVVLGGEEGGIHIVAENILQLMRLLTFDTEIYTDHTSTYFYRSSTHTSSEGAPHYRTWLKENFMQDPVQDIAPIMEGAQKKYKLPFDNWIQPFFNEAMADEQPFMNTYHMGGKHFDIISFTADTRQYYPAAMPKQNWMEANHVKHTDITIAPGQSRYGGPVIDLPPGVTLPDNLRFAAQLDLSTFAPFDKTGLLPKTGQLLFFSDIRTDTGKVIYADVPNDQLVRVIQEHEDNFFMGVLLADIYADTETMEERFRDPEDDDEKDDANEEGKIWDYFAGTDKSKIFGIFTHCQASEEEIAAITFSDKLLLLQVGENGFNDEGVFSVLIAKTDLKNRNFDHCEFAWGQS